MTVRFVWVSEESNTTSVKVVEWLTREVKHPMCATTMSVGGAEHFNQILEFECESLAQEVPGLFFGHYFLYKVSDVVSLLQRHIDLTTPRYDIFINGKSLLAYAAEQESLATKRCATIETGISMIRNLPRYLWFRPVHEVRLFLERSEGQK